MLLCFVVENLNILHEFALNADLVVALFTKIIERHYILTGFFNILTDFKRSSLYNSSAFFIYWPTQFSVKHTGYKM